ncbi:multicopper oxidase family protein [Nesterenkonia sp. HG001]|uniref:multicopper oxidase family protein n=1 Tax=Nesterenkonia sp. HG001 TaxID=2983207 RepID=UPI002AC5D3A7|nr:multicopper oxidase domain-containing protein [Nesterenkonia sp. HG001]MDZ5077563.1 multicopper oxidase domain-containing protein [Nesterenkonia sp. HG001]
MSPADRLLGRRHVLRLGVSGLGLAALGAAGCGSAPVRTARSTVGHVDFRHALHIPPLAEPTRVQGDDGARLTFDLAAQEGRAHIVDQGETLTWGINGDHLGPTLRARRGDTVIVRFTNGLSETTTLHWHGMHLPAEADGGPHQMVEPGESWEPSWRIAQPAATLWYHPHPHGETEAHVHRGIAGLFLLDDDEEEALDLPREYGVDDIPVIVQDRTFDAQGQLVETSHRNNGMLGETVLVNGTADPILEVSAERTRLRILNGSGARSYAFGFEDGRKFAMIASDGGLLPAPVRMERIMLTPGERAEILVDMEPAEEVVLRSFPQDLGLTRGMADSTGSGDELDIMLLRAAQTLRPASALPSILARLEALEETAASTVRGFELRTNRINGRSMDKGRIDEVVTAGTTEIWEVWNDHGQPHNVHIHDVQFQILSVGAEPPPPELAGWKDTVYLPPHERVRLIMRFSDYTSTEIPYMYHCHLLWHEDQGMMGQFVVVAPGEEDDVDVAPRLGDDGSAPREPGPHGH